MKRFLTVVTALFIGLTMLNAEAEAKRLGGGTTSGMSRNSNIMNRQATPAPAPNQATGTAAPQPTAAAQPNRSRWAGPLMGLAAGLGLGALFGAFGGGLGGGLIGTLLIAVLAFFAVRMIMGLFRRNQPSPNYAGAGAGTNTNTYYQPPAQDVPMIGGGLSRQAGADSSNTAAAQGGSIPADFDVEGFLRQAKLNFIRLQAANDAGNMEDIREVTTPEMFAEIRLQLQERKGEAQHTDVLNLNADLLDVSTEGKRHVASVRYFGTIREEKNGPAESFDEVWHLVKPVDGSQGWMIAGIQQMQ